MATKVLRGSDEEAVGLLPCPLEVTSCLQQPPWKRAIDIAGALVGLVLLSPFLLLVAAAIRVVSPGPAIFRQERVGYLGKRFMMWKFRTMKREVDSRVHQQYVAELAKTDGVLQKLPCRRALIPFGAVLRKFEIDELPQLINVLRGEMSLVGPRPDVLPYEHYHAHHRRRFEALPGMTGLWQVTGKNGTTFSEMIRMDIQYVEKRSLWLDLKILSATLPAIVARLGQGRAH